MIVPVSLVTLFPLLLLISQGYGWSYLPGDTSVRVIGDEPPFIILEMDEENKENVTIIVITGVNTSEFTENNLQIITENQDRIKFKVTCDKVDKCNVHVENKIDYDVDNSQSFRVIVSPANTGEHALFGFTLNIKNINDHKPEIGKPVCSMKENTTITVDNSTCEINIHDDDGNLQYMTFTIIDSSPRLHESGIFSMDYSSMPNPTVKDAKVYMYLQDGILLDFEEITLYIFDVFLLDKWDGDSTSQNTTVQAIINVEDIPDMPPLFTEIFSTKTFQEEEPQTFQVSAKDGDVTIKAIINYKVESEYNFISINMTSGMLNVKSIDRDTLGGTFDFKVIAYERDDPKWTAEQNVTFLVTDIDDNCPIFQVNNEDKPAKMYSQIKSEECPKQNQVKPIHLQFKENFLGPIDLDIEADDIDEGNNAKYTASIEESKKIGVTSAIQIVPQSGYKNWSFSLQIVNSSKLDYEDKDWREFSFEVKAVGELDNKKYDSFQVSISLTNVNDNPPIFQDTPYNVRVNETVKKGYKIIKVLAKDKDEGDIVRYDLIGAQNLEMDSSTGLVVTSADNAFDYEKIKELTIQIQASDNDSVHQTPGSIHIEVLDINDETPVLILSSGVSVDENRKQGEKITASISATDADEGCELEFSIDWENSYAMKNYGNVTDKIYQQYIKGCITIDTRRQSVHEYSAELHIIEIDKDNTPDYEKYDSLYLYIIVKDVKQEVNKDYDSGILVIGIKNLNDNPPEFTESTKKTIYRVTENADLNTSIGSVRAKDIDGNSINYTIVGVEQPEIKNWVAIDLDTGELTVNDPKIDADNPKRWNFSITVCAFDGIFSPNISIVIQITDTNDNLPQVDAKSLSFNTSIPEIATTGDHVDVQIVASDDDRDEPYRTLTYEFDKVSDYFRIDVQTGDIYVRLKNHNFDRDHGDKFYDLSVIIRDNPDNLGGRQNQCKDIVTIRVNLQDCNTQTPKIKDNSKNIQTWETLKKGENFEQIIQAEDDDEGDNAKIKFEIVNIVSPVGSKLPELTISTDPNYVSQTASLTAEGDLKGYYGEYTLTVRVTDFGDPPLNSTADIKLTISKFNFERPVIQFPKNGQPYYLRKEQQLNYPQLLYFDNRQFESLNVSNSPPGKWKYEFSLTQVTPGKQVFKLFGNGDGFLDSLELTELDDEIRKTNYTLQLDVSARNENEIKPEEAPYAAVPVTFNIQFYDLAPPHFKKVSQTYSWKENDPNLEIIIDKADFDVDIKTYDATISYVLYEDNDMFQVDDKTGTVTLKDKSHTLDYETQTEHKLRIRATTDKQSTSDDPFSIANITIEVEDVNDNAPAFKERLYYASVKETTENNFVILTVNAIDVDTVDKDKLKYEIVGEIDAKTKGTDDIVNPPFEIDKTTGEIKIKFRVFNTMSGYFTFSVNVTDSPPESHTDQAQVQVYIISSQVNLVEFNFENNLNDIVKKEPEIADIFKKQLGYKAYFDSLRYNDTSSTTVASIYFMDDMKLITSSEIMKRVTDITTFKVLRKELLEDFVNLVPFDSTSPVENIEQILKAWLIGTSVVLGTICLILMVAFILRTRSLSQRIKNLTVHRYGSQESGLNRLGVNAPTTNRHAIEGSNPVYTIDEKPKEDIDQVSIGSGDSDLIGIEDQPEFNYEIK